MSTVKLRQVEGLIDFWRQVPGGGSARGCCRAGVLRCVRRSNGNGNILHVATAGLSYRQARGFPKERPGGRLCKPSSYNGVIRARSNSRPARPYMARLRIFSLLICPSVCPLLQGSDTALRKSLNVLAYGPRKARHRVDARCASIGQPIVQALRRSFTKQASKAHRQTLHRGKFRGRRFQRVDVGDLPGGHPAAGGVEKFWSIRLSTRSQTL